MAKGKTAKRNRGNVHTNSAPTMQGMQQVGTWMLQQFVPVTIDTDVYDSSIPAIVQYVGSVNQWAWDLRQGGVVQVSQNLAYGELTEQFAELATLWATYRLDAIDVEFHPNMTGAGQQTACLSGIDPAGADTNFDPANALIGISRLRSSKLTLPTKVCRRKLDYRNWLTQTAPQPFLQTVDETLSTGVREQYPQGTANCAPVIRMAFQTTPGVDVNAGLVLGFFNIRAHYSVRGRRSQILPVPTRMMLMSDQERREAFEYLCKRYGRSQGLVIPLDPQAQRIQTAR